MAVASVPGYRCVRCQNTFPKAELAKTFDDKEHTGLCKNCDKIVRGELR